ncbi:MAG: AraC family transcriptional regulator [Cellulosilyticaceae bacterium]
MNYSKDIEQCVVYIEMHIKEHLTLQQIADEVGYSIYHFSRIFTACKGMTITEYIRQRKVSLARIDLLKGYKIIDVALDYGFETHTGFIKAFKKVFHYSPSQYIARVVGYELEKMKYEVGGYIMEPKIIQKESFKVAGYGIKTNISGTNFTKDIASFWGNYEGENLESKMYEILNPPKHGEVGLCVPNSGNGEVTYLLGVIVEDFSKVTQEMLTVEVPKATYAVFTTSPVDTRQDDKQEEFAIVIKETWKYIFEEWFKDSGYMYDESKIDFEFYDERCHGRIDTVMEIYVPIRKMSE